MVRHTIIGISYSPLYIHHFQFVQPSLLIRSEKLCKKYSDPSQINGTSEKLRWHRYRKGLRQSDVADYLGVDISTYNHLESYSCEIYSPEYMKKLSALFEIGPEELFDSYNMFIYSGQAQFFRHIRSSLCVTQKQLSEMLSVPLHMLKKWENEDCHISRKMWKHCMERLTHLAST